MRLAFILESHDSSHHSADGNIHVVFVVQVKDKTLTEAALMSPSGTQGGRRLTRAHLLTCRSPSVRLSGDSL